VQEGGDICQPATTVRWWGLRGSRSSSRDDVLRCDSVVDGEPIHGQKRLCWRWTEVAKIRIRAEFLSGRQISETASLNDRLRLDRNIDSNKYLICHVCALLPSIFYLLCSMPMPSLAYESYWLSKAKAKGIFTQEVQYLCWVSYMSRMCTLAEYLLSSMLYADAESCVRAVRVVLAK
jgi:hypothetical protein